MAEDFTRLEVAWGDSADLATLAARLEVDPKSRATGRIAFGILAIFGLTLLALLLGGLLLVMSKTPAEAEQIVNKILVPYLQEVRNFVSTLFGPLLAFILGYYFASHKDT